MHWQNQSCCINFSKVRYSIAHHHRYFHFYEFVSCHSHIKGKEKWVSSQHLVVVEVAEGSVSLEQWLWLDVVWLYGKILSYLKEPFHIAEKNSIIPENEIWLPTLSKSVFLDFKYILSLFFKIVFSLIELLYSAFYSSLLNMHKHHAKMMLYSWLCYPKLGAVKSAVCLKGRCHILHWMAKLNHHSLVLECSQSTRIEGPLIITKFHQEGYV